MILRRTLPIQHQGFRVRLQVDSAWDSKVDSAINSEEDGAKDSYEDSKVDSAYHSAKDSFYDSKFDSAYENRPKNGLWELQAEDDQQHLAN